MLECAQVARWAVDHAPNRPLRFTRTLNGSVAKMMGLETSAYGERVCYKTFHNLLEITMWQDRIHFRHCRQTNCDENKGIFLRFALSTF